MNKLNNEIIERFSRQILIDSIGINGQKKIIGAKALIIGCGGLGTSAAQYLSMTGVGHIGLVDDDTISLSNLNRQTLFTEKEIGKKKVNVLLDKLKKINSKAEIKKFNVRVNNTNIKQLANKYDYILDCSDNFTTRFLVNKFCHINKKILVTAALQNFDVQATILKSWYKNDNPCYECFFPNSTDYPQDSCDEMGILASVAGLGGIFQANLLINDILCKKKITYNKLILFSCSEFRMRKIKFRKNLKCKICKNN